MEKIKMWGISWKSSFHVCKIRGKKWRLSETPTFFIFSRIFFSVSVHMSKASYPFYKVLNHFWGRKKKFFKQNFMFFLDNDAKCHERVKGIFYNFPKYVTFYVNIFCTLRCYREICENSIFQKSFFSMWSSS